MGIFFQVAHLIREKSTGAAGCTNSLLGLTVQTNVSMTCTKRRMTSASTTPFAFVRSPRSISITRHDDTLRCSPILVCIILGHLALALWEGGMYPFPLSPAVAAAEAFVSICYVAHVLLNLWTFGVKQYRCVNIPSGLVGVASIADIYDIWCFSPWNTKQCR